jgi:hypothetical protein
MFHEYFLAVYFFLQGLFVAIHLWIMIIFLYYQMYTKFTHKYVVCLVLSTKLHYLK